MGLGVLAVVLGLGVGVALDPQAVAFIIRLLGGKDGVTGSWACVAGSVAVETLVALAALLLVRFFGNVRVNPAHVAPGGDTVALLEALLGIALVVQAISAFVRGSEGTNALVERALSDVDAVPASTAFAVGVTLASWTMPVVAGAVLTQVHGPSAMAIALGLLLVFLVVAMSTRLLPILLQTWRPTSAGDTLAAVRAWIERRGGPVAAAGALVIGLVFTVVAESDRGSRRREDRLV